MRIPSNLPGLPAAHAHYCYGVLLLAVIDVRSLLPNFALPEEDEAFGAGRSLGGGE